MLVDTHAQDHKNAVPAALESPTVTAVLPIVSALSSTVKDEMVASECSDTSLEYATTTGAQTVTENVTAGRDFQHLNRAYRMI